MTDISRLSLAGVPAAAIPQADAVPVVGVNVGITVAEGSTGNVITQAMLEATDADNTAAELTYTLDSAPSEGTLRLSGSPLSVSATWTQEDINNNLLTYDHAAGELAADSFSFTVDDGTGNDASDSFSITVTPVNDAPVLANIEGGSLAYTEGDGAVPFTSTITVTDVDDANIESATFMFVSNYQNGEDQLAFVDANGITGSWDAPSGMLTLTGTATVLQYQAALRSVTYENLSEDPFTSSRLVMVTVNDGDTDSNSPTRGISVTAAPDPPVLANIEPGALAYAEGDGDVNVTSTITVADVDDIFIESASIEITGNYVNGEDVLSFSGGGGSWNASFGILSLTTQLSLSAWQDKLREVQFTNNAVTPTESTRTISFTVNDGTSDSNTVTRDVVVGAVNDAQVISTNTGDTVLEGSTDNVVTQAMLETTDTDNTPAELTYTLTGEPSNGVLYLDGVELSAPDTWTQADINNNLLTYDHDGGENVSDSFDFSVTDGQAAASTGTFNFTITPVDDAPLIHSVEGAALAFAEGDGPTAVTSTLAVSDLDSANLVSATVQLTTGYENGEDVLSFVNANGITGTWTAGTGTMALSGSASLANYQAAIRSITFNTADPPSSTATRTIEFTVNDGTSASNTATRNISVSLVNDEEVLATNTGITVLEGSTNNVITQAMLETTDEENTPAQLTYTLDVAVANGTLYLSGSPLSVSNTWTQADINNNLLTYDHDGGETVSDSFDFTVDDGTGTSTSDTFAVTVTPVDDAPVIASVEGGSLAFDEGDGPTAVTSTLTVADVDSANLVSATVQLTTGYENGDDVLAFVNANGITGTWAAGTGTMTLSGSSSVANYQAAIRSITFDTAVPAVPGARTIEFTVNDGTSDSNTATRGIAVATNMPPVLANVEGGALAYTENDGAVAITSSLTVTDAESDDIVSAAIQITGNYVNGEDVLAFADAGGITGTWVAGTATMTLSGTATVAQYQAAIRTVTYENTSEDPSAASRTVAFTVADAFASSNTVTRSITVGPVNDKQVLTTNTGATFLEGSTGNTITQAMLNTLDVDNTPAQLIYTVSGGPSDGTLYLDGTPLVPSDTWTQQDINDGLLTYDHDGSENPTDLFSFDVEDGSGFNDFAVFNFTITGVNDAPVLAAIEVGNLAYAEGDGPVAITSTITAADVDSANLVSAVVQITGNYQNGEDVLAFVNANGITGTWTAGTGILDLAGSSSVANYQAALRSVTYNNTSGSPAVSTRTISFTVSDAAAASNTVSRGVAVAASNDPPTLSTNDGLTVIEGSAGNVVTQAVLETTDVDDTPAQLTYSLDVAPVEGTLRRNGVVLSVSDTWTQEDINNNLLTYNHAAGEVAADSFDFTVTDSASNQITGTFNFTITPVDDAPVLSAVEPGALTYTEGDGDVNVTSTIIVADADSANMVSGEIQITTGYVQGEDVLAFSGGGGVWDAPSGTLSLSSTVSLAAWQTLLRSVQFTNASEDPTVSTRTVTFKVNDGTSDSNIASRDVSVVAVNDPMSLVTNTGATFAEGSTGNVITQAMLETTDIDNTPAEIVYKVTVLPPNGTLRVNGVPATVNSLFTQAQVNAGVVLYDHDGSETVSDAFDFEVSDNVAAAISDTFSMTITAVDDAPTLSNIETSALNFYEGDDPKVVSNAILVTDPDTANMVSAVVEFASGYVQGEDVLTFVNQGGITGTWDVGLGRMTLTGSADLNTYTTALRSITYDNATVGPATNTRVVSFKVNDGNSDSNVASRTIQVWGDTGGPAGPEVPTGAKGIVCVPIEITPCLSTPLTIPCDCSSSLVILATPNLTSRIWGWQPNVGTLAAQRWQSNIVVNTGSPAVGRWQSR